MDMGLFKSNIFKVICLMGLFFSANISFAETPEQIKEHAYALYATKNYNEAFQLLDNLPNNEKKKKSF